MNPFKKLSDEDKRVVKWYTAGLILGAAAMYGTTRVVGVTALNLTMDQAKEMIKDPTLVSVWKTDKGKILMRLTEVS
jgi:hypothetical protein